MYHKRNLWISLVILLLILLGVSWLVLGPQHKSATVTPQPSPTVAAPSPSSSASPSQGASPSPAAIQYHLTDADTFAGKVPPVPQLVAVRVQAFNSAGYDRISMDFKQAAAPGWQARYVDKVLRDGSGQVVAMPGQAYLQITFNPAQAHDEAGKSTLNPAATTPVATNLRELQAYVMNGDFEGHVNIALGTAAKNGFHFSSVHNITAGTWTLNFDLAQKPAH